MPNQGLEIFDRTLQKTHEWLNDIMKLLNWNDRQKAYTALRGTIQALRDRLPNEVAVKFGAQLPMLVRGFYYEGWKPSIAPVKVKSSEDFVDFISSHLNSVHLEDETDREQVVRAVLQVIAKHVSEGEIELIKQVLPRSLALLWPASS
jgi:uncharacterized protein (DUF2267 family)